MQTDLIRAKVFTWRACDPLSLCWFVIKSSYYLLALRMVSWWRRNVACLCFNWNRFLHRFVSRFVIFVIFVGPPTRLLSKDLFCWISRFLICYFRSICYIFVKFVIFVGAPSLVRFNISYFCVCCLLNCFFSLDLLLSLYFIIFVGLLRLSIINICYFCFSRLLICHFR